MMDSPAHPVRVLIVDDSATLRRLLRSALEADPRIRVVGDAADPLDAREKIKALNPDVLTLDVEMPRMNGIEFLDRLMRLRPMPVVMVSTLTRRGSAAAIEALSLGAVDCIGKPAQADGGAFLADLPDRVVAAASARVRLRSGSGDVTSSGTAAAPGGFSPADRIVLIGASTGGVDALERVLSGLPANCAPTFITQHMPDMFLASFARRLDGRVAPRVSLAKDGAAVGAGEVVIAPGGATHLELAPGSGVRCRLVTGERISGHRPSVDALFLSALSSARRIVAAVLTGMGRDGAEGMRMLRAEGARCFVQDEETSVVYGMPRAALAAGGAERALPLDAIAGEIVALTRAGRELAEARR